MAGKILILAILDVRGEEINFLCDCIKCHGFQTIVMDIGFEAQPLINADITRDLVAKKAGVHPESVKFLNRDEAHAMVIRGAISIVNELHANERFAGIIALGGATTGLISSSVMTSLPFGLPKLIVSSAAALPVGTRFFNNQDVTIMHSVVNISGLNNLLESIIVRAAGAICGMAGSVPEIKTSKQAEYKASVATTVFGLTKRCAMYIRNHLDNEGYEVVSFHAQGSGDRSMEDLLADGKFDAVIDIVPRGLSEQIFDGGMAAGDKIFTAACKRGIPQIIAPGGLNLLAARKYQTKYHNRKSYTMDDSRALVRLNSREMITIARAMAERFNKAKGPVKFVIPLRGWSAADPPGSSLYEPDTDKAFVKELRNNLSKGIEIKEVDAWLESPEFARAIFNTFLEVMRKRVSEQKIIL